MGERLLFITVLLVVQAYYSSGEPLGICPAINDVYVTFLQDSDSCSVFYKCDWGVPYKYDCPGGLDFNTVLNVCDWPEQAHCALPDSDNGGYGDSIDGDDNTDHLGDGGYGDNGDGNWVGECPEEDGENVVHVPHESDCTLFYKCESGTPVLYECPSNLHFNPVLEVCDFPENAGCQNGSGNNGDGNDGDDSEGNGSDGDENGDGEDESEIGDGDDENNSDDGDNNEDNDNGSWVGECPEEDGENAVHLPHESDCTLFYKCDRGTPVLYECPLDLHYNPVLEVCDFPEDAGCQNGSGNNGDGNDGDDSEGNGSDGDENGDGEDENNSDDGDNNEGNGDGNWVGECPEEDGENVAHLPHESDCTLFYKCDRGTPVLYECPLDLHFNPVLEICDFPENAGCQNGSGNNGDDNDGDDSEGNGSDGDENGDGEDENEIGDGDDENNSDDGDNNEDNDNGNWVGECPEEDGENAVHLPHESDCTLFYKCDRGTPVLYECPLDLHFNPVLEVCDFPENAGCQNGSGNNSGGNDGDDSEGNGSDGDENGDGEDENEIGDGDDENNSDDGDNNEDNDNGNWVGECPEEDGENAVHLSHESDCTLFYKCDRGTPVLYECPLDLHFNPVLEICDFPENAGCQNGSGNNSGGNDGDDSEGNGSDGDENGDGEDENEIGDGDDENNSDDGDNNEDNDNGNWVGECPEEDGENAVHLPHESDCTLFYKCDRGTPVLYECPLDLHFNPVLEVCDFPENAGCENGSGNNGDDNDGDTDDLEGDGSDEDGNDEGEDENDIGDGDNENGGDDGGNGNGTWVGECPEEDGEDVVHLPHESDCTLFYKCERGAPVLYECPAGLHFNPVLEVCDFPEDAGCENGSGNNGDDNDGDTDDLEGDGSDEDGNDEGEDENDIGDGDNENGGDDGGNGNGTWVGECPEEDGEDVVHLPHESDCTLFYKCERGAPVLYECPAGLHFNPVLEVCDFPEDAGCENGSGNNGDDNDGDTDDLEGDGSDEDGNDEGEDENDIGDGDNESDGDDGGNGNGSWVGECPVEDGENVVHLPHESDCTLFYKCDRGTPVLYECPLDLHFNPVLEVCDFPEDAGCQNGSGNNGDGSDEDDNGDDEGEDDGKDENDSGNNSGDNGDDNWIGECPEEDGEFAVHIPHASDCNLFYICNRGTPVLYECPFNLHFNPTLGVCDFPENAGCQNGSGGDNEDGEDDNDDGDNNGDNGDGNWIGECPAEDGEYAVHLPHESDCTLFYKCDRGTPVLQECPSGLYFNPVASVCDFPENSGCQSGPDGGGNDGDTDDLEGDGSDEESNEDGGWVGECPEEDGQYITLLPDASSCTIFYKCDRGTPVVQECPSGLHFNPVLLVCDYPEDAGCQNGSGGNDGGGDGGDSDEDGDSNGDGDGNGGSGFCNTVSCPEINEEYVTFIPFDSDCTRFCKCNWGLAYEFVCPAGLYFNPTLNVCDYPNDSGCTM